MFMELSHYPNKNPFPTVSLTYPSTLLYRNLFPHPLIFNMLQLFPPFNTCMLVTISRHLLRLLIVSFQTPIIILSLTPPNDRFLAGPITFCGFFPLTVNILISPLFRSGSSVPFVFFFVCRFRLFNGQQC